MRRLLPFLLCFAMALTGYGQNFRGQSYTATVGLTTVVMRATGPVLLEGGGTNYLSTTYSNATAAYAAPRTGTLLLFSSNDLFYALSSAGVLTSLGGGLTDGDKGDITVSGSGATFTIDNNVVSYAKMQDISATQRALGRNTAGSGDPEEVTLSQLLDWIGSAAQGDILYRGAATWARLGAGTTNQFLKTLGTGFNPAWATPAGSGAGFPLSADADANGFAITNILHEHIIRAFRRSITNLTGPHQDFDLNGPGIALITTTNNTVINIVKPPGTLWASGLLRIIDTNATTSTNWMVTLSNCVAATGSLPLNPGTTNEIWIDYDGANVFAFSAQDFPYVIDATVGAAGDGDTTHAYSKNNIRDYLAQQDPDFDGLPNGVEVAAITSAMLRDSAALSVIGRSANSIGVPADIATAADGDVLRRSGTTLGFGTITSNSVADATINFRQIQSTTQYTFMGRVIAGTGPFTNLSADDTLIGLETASTAARVGTGKFVLQDSIVDAMELPMGAWRTNDLLGAHPSGASSGSFSNIADVFIFANSVTNGARILLTLQGWDAGVIRVELDSNCGGTNDPSATNVVFASRAAALKVGDDWSNPTFGTLIPMTNHINMAANTSGRSISRDITVGNTPASTNAVLLEIQRLGADAGDTMTNSPVRVTRAKVYYTKTIGVAMPAPSP